MSSNKAQTMRDIIMMRTAFIEPIDFKGID